MTTQHNTYGSCKISAVSGDDDNENNNIDNIPYTQECYCTLNGPGGRVSRERAIVGRTCKHLILIMHDAGF